MQKIIHSWLLLAALLLWTGSVRAAYTPNVTENEVSVFLETSCSNAKVWAWNDKGNHAAVAWPGDEMTLVGQTADGKNVFKWTYTGTLAVPTGVIFSHDGGTKFVDKDLEYVNHGYYVDGVYSKTIKPLPEGKVVVYFDNTDTKFEQVYCYLYDGTTAAVEWPGTPMTFDEAATYGGKTGLYTLEVPQDFVFGNYVVNDGKGATSLSGETVYVEGETVSAIERIDGSALNAAEGGVWYTLAGMRVSKPTQAGIYIHNGKKIIIRQ